VVVSFQNGFNIERIAKYVPLKQIIGGVPNYTSALVDPGHLEFTAEGWAHIGEMDGTTTDRLRHLEWLLSRLTTVEVITNIVGEIWAKQAHMCMIVMTALVDGPISDILAHERCRRMGAVIVREAIQVAKAAGVTVSEKMQIYDAKTPEETRRLMKYLEDMGARWSHRRPDREKLVKKASGIWWDIVYRKRKSETTELAGAVVNKAKELGVPVPANERLVEMIYEIEDGKRKLGWHNIDELESYMNSVGAVLRI